MTSQRDEMPEPLTIDARRHDLDDLLGREWLLTNRIGAYASSSSAGCNTRRYHGLLVAARTPPVGRMVMLSSLMEQLAIGEDVYDLATNEFDDAFSPRGAMHLEKFVNDPVPTFVYRVGNATLTKQIVLADTANASAIRYRLEGADKAVLRIRPVASLRDFHHLRRFAHAEQITFDEITSGIIVHDRYNGPGLCLVTDAETFSAQPEWWYRFFYRVDHARGQDCHEDLYIPGTWSWRLSDGQSAQITASLDEPVTVEFERTCQRRLSRLERLVEALGPDADDTTRRLAMASDAFVVNRSFPARPPSSTILAGFHWFADWGRDAFIALPGLLLETGQLDRAREVFKLFAEHIHAGLVPNRFDDYSELAHYNAIDASLWFIVAAERYMLATDDTQFLKEVLLPACETILRGYTEGTDFGIRADGDGLLTGGDANTQLTWMDAKLGDQAVTPRHGKAVEINALWHSAHRILALRCQGIDDRMSDHFAAKARQIADSFSRAFWNEQYGWLNDCIADGQGDATLRPNQILAVSLPHSPLSDEQQRAVVGIVTEKLLTPAGLRSLSPDDPRYRRRYGGSWESRDRSYHQGTVWGWLMGPFIEAYLKVHGTRPVGVGQAASWLKGFDEHLLTHGIGYISEIFDGDAPHTPRGCIAQAWSVGEVLRAKRLVARYQAQLSQQK